MFSSKPNQTYRSIAVVALVIVGLAACQKEPPRTIYGSLYFEAGPYLGELQLATGNAMPVTNLGDQRIERVSAFADGDLLLSIRVYVNERRRERLVRFDPLTLQRTQLVGGQSGQYLPASSAVVYTVDDKLLTAPHNNVRRGARLVATFDWGHPPTIVPIGEHGALVADADGPIRRLDPSTASEETLEALSQRCALRDAVWLENREQLVCRSRDQTLGDTALVVVELSGRQMGVLPLPEGRVFRAVAYLADQRVLILNEQRYNWFARREEHPVWAYDMDDGELLQIAENQPLGDSVVYGRKLR